VPSGVVFSRTGSFSSTATGSFSAAVNYGDGGGLQPLALTTSNTFTLSHSYAQAGAFTITVAVTDPFGVVETQTLSVLVQPLVSGFGVGRDAFVISLYRDDLGRLPEPSGLRFWSRVLAARVKPKTVALAIWRSPEHRWVVNQHLVTPIRFRRTFVDAMLAGKKAARSHATAPAGPLASR